VSDGDARKLVTVVFCDLADSTAFADAHDPEVVTSVLSRYFEVARGALEQHGGTVEKFIGDAVVGVFGVPRLREDDAVRAVRAAAAIRDGISSLNEELARGVGVELAVRVGVNSGQVLARERDDASGIAYGDPLNVAARLQQHAQAGEVLIGAETLGLVGSRIVVEPSEPLRLKGKSTPVGAARLVGLAEEVPAFERPIRSRFVGRGRELAALRDRVSLAREGEPQLVTVVGEPGIGKSRLIREVITQGAITQEAGAASPLVGRCLAYGDGITYWPLAEILRQLERRPGGVDAILAGDPDAELIASRLGAARGEAVDAAPGEVAWAARRLIEHLAESGLVFVVVDDIHWAEPVMLDLIEYLSATIQGRVVLLCATRPELLESRPAWATPRPGASLILLPPLDDGEVATLAASLANGGGDRGWAQRLVSWTAGNPLFVEQIMAARDDGSLDEQTPPQSIQTLLASRVDQLPASERELLTCAGVEGRLFHRGALAALLADELRASLDTALLALVRKQFIRADRAEFPGDDAYRFVHALVRDAAYDALPIRRRAMLHERYADWLEAQPIALAEVEELLAYHLEQAHRFRVSVGLNDETTIDVARRAGDHLLAAGLRANARWDLRAVVDLLGRAQPLLDEARWLDVAVTYGENLVFWESMPAGLASLKQTVVDAERAGRDDIACQAKLQVYRKDRTISEEATRQAALAALERFPAETHPETAAAAYQALAIALGNSGRSGEAAEADLRSIQIARQAGLQRLASESQQDYSLWIVTGPTPAQEAIQRLEEMLAQPDAALRDRLGILPALAALHAMRCHTDQTRRLAAEVEQIQERRGVREGLADHVFAIWLGPALAQIGDTDAAITLLRATCETFRRRQNTGILSGLAATLGIVLVDAGTNLDEADALCEESRRFTQPDDALAQILWRILRAKLLRHAGHPDQALPFAEQALTYAEQTDGPDKQADALALIASLHADTGSPIKADELRARALALYRQKGHLAGERHLSGEDAIAGTP
jgi:class 3 adenylate cyclase/tetratricopeptide (TPR) repeat protein